MDERVKRLCLVTKATSIPSARSGGGVPHHKLLPRGNGPSLGRQRRSPVGLAKKTLSAVSGGRSKALKRIFIYSTSISKRSIGLHMDGSRRFFTSPQAAAAHHFCLTNAVWNRNDREETRSKKVSPASPMRASGKTTMTRTQRIFHRGSTLGVAD